MAEGLFNYTPTNNVKVNTQPVMVNQKADLKASKAFQNISNLVKAGTQAYTTYEDTKDKTSLIEASNEANEAHKWYSQEINKTTDPYKQNEVLQQYTTALDSIEQGYELKDEYKKTFTSSNLKFRGEQERVIGKRVLAQQIADTDEGLGNLAASLAGAPSTEIATVMKDATTAYTNLGLSKELASDKIFATVVNKKIEAFNIDPLYSDLSQLEKEVESFVQAFDPKLKNKENDTKYKKLLSDLKDEQKGLAKAHLETFLSSEVVGQKEFDEEADNLSHAFSKLEISNMKEAKANKVYALKIQSRTREKSEQTYKTETLVKNYEAVYNDPNATEEEFKAIAKQMQDSGVKTPTEITSETNRFIEKRKVNEQLVNDTNAILKNPNSTEADVDATIAKMKESNQWSETEATAYKAVWTEERKRKEREAGNLAATEKNKKYEQLREDTAAVLLDPTSTLENVTTKLNEMVKADQYSKIESKAKLELWKSAKAKASKAAAKKTQDKLNADTKKEATRIVADVLGQKSTKDGMSPQMLGGYLALKNGGVISKEDQKAYDKYRYQWGLENSATDLVTMISMTSNSYVGTEVEAGTVAALNNATTNMYSNDSFSASGILQIYANHDLKGQVVNFIKKDLGNTQTAVQAITKVKAMKAINDPAVQTMLGDKLYYQLAALESRMTSDKDGNPVITPNDLRDIEQILANPDQVKIDRSSFNEALKENPYLYKFGAEFDIALKLGADVDDVLENIKAKSKQEFPAPGVSLTGYKGINLTKDDQAMLESLPKAVNSISPQYNGIAYNPTDGRFYYSSLTDKFSDIITRPTDTGGVEAVTNLNGVDGVISVLETKITNKYKDKYGDGMYKQLESIGSPARFIGDKLKDLSDSVLSFNPKAKQTTFEESPLGSLWEKLKDGSSGLQASELMTGQYSLTYNSEVGTDSTKLHNPGTGSGVTIGAGYDMKHRTESDIVKDLTAVGVDKDRAVAMSKGAGLKGDEADAFAKSNSTYSITEEQQKKLFDISIKRYEKKAKKDYASIIKDVKNAPKFEQLPSTVQALLVDYTYNIGSAAEFPDFFRFLITGEKEKALQEYPRYSEGQELVKRNNDTLKVLNKYDFKDLTK